MNGDFNDRWIDAAERKASKVKRVQRGDARTRNLKGPGPTELEVVMSIRLPKDLHRRVRIYAAEREITVKALVLQAVNEKMEKEGA